MKTPSPERYHNLRVSFSRRRSGRSAGVALVIVLAFIALLTGLVVAYFAQSMASRQLANSSASQTKSAQLARSASDIVIAGLKQEIAAGSYTTPPFPTPTPVPGVNTAIYVPNPGNNNQAGAYAVPVRFPVPATGDPMPNLVRYSVRSDSSIPAPAVPSLASPVNSATDAALNGHAISPARWNSHYLLPCYQAVANAAGGNNVAPTTPDSYTNYSPPDWVLVNRNGPTAQSSSPDLTNGPTSLNNPQPTNSNYIIGRYAYAIYDEGGLLDMNVAGHPTSGSTVMPTGTPVPGSTPPYTPALPFTPAQIGQKGSLAMADLTQLPTSSPAGSTLSQAYVDDIVGWRNTAAAQPTGYFPGFTFTSTQANSWFTNFAYKNNTGFLKAFSAASTNSQPAVSDQAIVSRQQLLQLCTSIGFSPNVLQFMGTFSRGLEQPSYVPPHLLYPSTAPAINNLSTTSPPAASSVDSYYGNNDAAGTSQNGTSGQDVINPALLTVRVMSTFTRADLNHYPPTMAVVGEPLLKTKFPLSRLGEISYSATDSTPSLTDPKFVPVPSNATAVNHIKDWFGLSRTSASSPWTYNHEPAGTTTVSIMTLQQVAAAGRDPDFAELLKAAINVGSLAKGGPNLHNNQGNYQYTVDTATDYNVLQIMANLIDQYDSDSYPTIIQLTNSVNGIPATHTFRGVEDLPYFYRYHQMTVMTTAPSPQLTRGQSVVFYNASDTTGANPITTVYDCVPGGGLSSPGQAVFLYVPDIWNPHDASTALTGNASLRPTRFRLSVITDDPINATPSWNTGTVPVPSGAYYGLIPQTASVPNGDGSLCTPLTEMGATSTAFTFSDNAGQLFREPTLLYRSDVPTNAALAPDNTNAGPYVDYNSKVAYYGVLIGKSPVSFVGTVDTTQYRSNPAGSGSYVFQASTLAPQQQVPAAGYAQYTFRLEYQDPNGSGTWLVYDEKYPDFHGLGSPNVIANTADYTNGASNQYLNIWSTQQINDASTGYDPRVSRFGIGTGDSLKNASVPMLERNAANNFALTGASNYSAFGASNFTILVTERPNADAGNVVSYSNPGMTSDPGKNAQMRWFSGVGFSASNGTSGPVEFDGLLSQNNPAATVASRSAGQMPIYYEDADGVARRAMAAYTLTGAMPSPTPNAAPVPYATSGARNTDGFPLATANNYPPGNFGVGTPWGQNLSRPIVLNRPFRSVAEMSYSSRGAPWKQLDFLTPESGDTALLDVFCVNEVPTSGIVAGKVNLNTHQAPVLAALVAGTSRDETSNLAPTTPITYAPGPVTGAEALNVANKLISITTDKTDYWRGPLVNVGDLVGHFVNSAGGNGASSTETYSFNETLTNANYTYAGLSSALDNTVYTSAATSAYASAANYKAERLREAAMRALADSGQTRVWNLMIDVVAQTGRYTANSTKLSQFAIDGESRYWVHVAIDRSTGQVLDKQIELVSE